MLLCTSISHSRNPYSVYCTPVVQQQAITWTGLDPRSVTPYGITEPQWINRHELTLDIFFSAGWQQAWRSHETYEPCCPESSISRYSSIQSDASTHCQDQAEATAGHCEWQGKGHRGLIRNITCNFFISMCGLYSSTFNTISWLLMTWWSEESEHQQTCYGPYYTPRTTKLYIGFTPSVRPSVPPSIPHPVSAL